MGDEGKIVDFGMNGNKANVESNEPKLPEGVKRMDFFMVERVIKDDGTMYINLRTDSSDKNYIMNELSAFEILGVLEKAKHIVLSDTVVKNVERK